jgi:hypothetical protein
LWCHGRNLLPYRLRTTRSNDGWLSVTLGTALGLGLGMVAGVVVGEWLGAMHPERVRRLLRGSTPPAPPDAAELERAVRRALKMDATTRRLDISARAIDGGVVELTGTVPDERTRRAAGDAAASVAGNNVVNRILVEGTDVPPPPGKTAGP